MVDSMERYVMPPSFDFLTYPDDVTPVTMYIFEFEHTLNQQDLTDIWQNLPPRIARAFDPDDGLCNRSNYANKRNYTFNWRQRIA